MSTYPIIPINPPEQGDDKSNIYYARLFVTFFTTKFKEAEANNDNVFVINTSEFDEFVIAYRLTLAYDSQLVTGNRKAPIAALDPMRWNQLRKDSNTIRHQINDVAAYGKHGDPAYRLDASSKKKNPTISVRLTSDIISLTASEYLESLELTLTNKKKNYIALVNEWNKNSHLLTKDLQVELKVLSRQVDAFVGIAIDAVNRGGTIAEEIGVEVEKQYADLRKQGVLKLDHKD